VLRFIRAPIQINTGTQRTDRRRADLDRGRGLMMPRATTTGRWRETVAWELTSVARLVAVGKRVKRYLAAGIYMQRSPAKAAGGSFDDECQRKRRLTAEVSQAGPTALPLK